MTQIVVRSGDHRGQAWDTARWRLHADVAMLARKMFRPLRALALLSILPFTLTLAYRNTTTTPANITSVAAPALERPARSSSIDGGPGYDDHTQPHAHVTLAQLTFFLSCAAVSALWLLAHLTRVLRKPLPAGAVAADEVEKGLLPETQPHSRTARADGEATSSSLRGDGAAASQVGGGDVGPGNDVKAEAASSTSSRPSAPPVPSLDEILQGVAEFGIIMFYFFLCDYIKILPEEPRVYNRDQFLFFIFLVFAVGFAFTMKTNKDMILGREQTEEWKGWMQVMFVWYHYFAAKEWYNWIRIYIACYVWMTGFGNFSFFWVRGDYSLWRVLKMLFRINFLVIAVVVVTANEYMLYYICAMHTYWFLTVYLFMRTLTSWNTHRWKMAAKFAAYVVCNALVFDIPGVASFLFRPLWFVFQFHDDVHDVMHEWEFRGGLDHWACLLGMLCAYNYPHLEALLRHLDTASHSPKEAKRKQLVRAGLGAGGVLLGTGWYWAFMRAEKLAYNRLHPYTSLLPIPAYLLLRNLHPALRRRHLGLFAALGRITLETYLSQLHVYLQSNAKHLLGYLPGYPLLTFALATIVYLLISKRLFELTLRFSAFFIQKEWRKSLKSVVVGVAAVGLSLCLSAGVLWSRGTL